MPDEKQNLDQGVNQQHNPAQVQQPAQQPGDDAQAVVNAVPDIPPAPPLLGAAAGDNAVNQGLEQENIAAPQPAPAAVVVVEGVALAAEALGVEDDVPDDEDKGSDISEEEVQLSVTLVSLQTQIDELKGLIEGMATQKQLDEFETKTSQGANLLSERIISLQEQIGKVINLMKQTASKKQFDELKAIDSRGHELLSKKIDCLQEQIDSLHGLVIERAKLESGAAAAGAPMLLDTVSLRVQIGTLQEQMDSLRVAIGESPPDLTFDLGQGQENVRLNLHERVKLVEDDIGELSNCIGQVSDSASLQEQIDSLQQKLTGLLVRMGQAHGASGSQEGLASSGEIGELREQLSQLHAIVGTPQDTDQDQGTALDRLHALHLSLSTFSEQVRQLENRLMLQEQKTKVDASVVQQAPASGGSSDIDQLKQQLEALSKALEVLCGKVDELSSKEDLEKAVDSSKQLAEHVRGMQQELGTRGDFKGDIFSALNVLRERTVLLTVNLEQVGKKVDEGRNNVEAVKQQLDALSKALADLCQKVEGLSSKEELDKAAKQYKEELERTAKQYKEELEGAVEALVQRYKEGDTNLESRIKAKLDAANEEIQNLGGRVKLLTANQGSFVSADAINEAVKQAKIMTRVYDVIESGDKFALRSRRMRKYSFAADVLALLLFISIILWGVFIFAFPVNKQKANIMGLSIELIALFAVLVCLIVFLSKKHCERTDLAELRELINKLERDEDTLDLKGINYLKDEHAELIGSYRKLLAPLSVPRKIQTGIRWFNAFTSVLIEIMLVTDMLTGGYISRAHGNSPINVENGLFLGLTCLTLFSVIIELSLVTSDYIKQKKNSRCDEKEKENTKGSIARIVILSSVVLTTLATIAVRVLRSLESTKTVKRFTIGATGGELAIGLLLASMLCFIDLIFSCVDSKDLFKKEVGSQVEQAQTLRQAVLKATIPTLGGV